LGSVGMFRGVRGCARWRRAACREHVVIRLRHGQQPFRGLPRGACEVLDDVQRVSSGPSRLMFKLGALRSHGVVVAPPQVQIAVPSAA
jgi:hypothetical protein